MTQVAEEKAMVPELRFSGFSGEWNKSKIQDLIDEKFILGHLDGNHGELYPRSEEFTNDGVPYVSANNLDGNNVDLLSAKKLPIERAAQFKKGIAQTGDVLFAHNATVGPTGLLETKLEYVILSTTVTYYRCDLDKLSNQFLLASFNADYFVKQYSRVMSQSTRNQVPITMQRKFHLWLPEIEEQQKIARFLTAVDEKLNNLRRKRECLQNYKRGVMQKIFSQEIRFTQDDGSAFPDWEEKKANVLFRNHSNKNHHSDLPILAVTQDRGVVDRSDVDIDIKTSSQSVASYKVIEPGDFVISLRSFQGGIEYSNVLGISSPAYTVLKPNLEINDDFFRIYFKKEDFISKLSSTVIGIRDGKQISYDAFSILKLPYPSPEEQKKISEFIGSIEDKIEVISEKISAAEAFKKGLLQKMFV